MNNDLPTGGGGRERIEHQIGNDLSDFTPKAHDYPLCLNALIKNYSLPLSVRMIKVQYLADHRTQLEFGRQVVVAVKLEHLGSDTTETFYLFFHGGNISLRLGSG